MKSMKKYSYKIDPREYSKEYYLADTYAGSKQFKEGQKQLVATLDRIYKKIPVTTSAKTFLDAGCGKGELLLFMKKKGYEVFGIDYSSQAVQIAKKLMKKFHVHAVIKRKDVRDTSFPNSKFDYVISTDVVEHLDDNDAVVDFFNESYRILKKGGVLHIHTAPNALHVEYFEKYYFRYVNYLFLTVVNYVFHKKFQVSLALRETYNKKFHINEQTYFTLLNNIKKSKFRSFSLELFAYPFEFTWTKFPYYLIAYLYPLNKIFPFSLILANHIYLIAKK